MIRPSPYFMHDQVRHRVALIMRHRHRPLMAAPPVWLLLAVIATLTIINVMTAMPRP